MDRKRVMTNPKNIDDYIESFPEEIRNLLDQMRTTITKAAPNAEELISYGMPAFKLNGMLVWFAAHTKHIGFYPRGSGIEEFKQDISNYKSSKGAVQFPFDKPLPLDLITKIVEFRVNQNMEKSAPKKK